MQVIDGFEALDLMEREPVDGNDRPLNDIKIHRIIMHANPIAENEQVWFNDIWMHKSTKYPIFSTPKG